VQNSTVELLLTTCPPKRQFPQVLRKAIQLVKTRHISAVELLNVKHCHFVLPSLSVKILTVGHIQTQITIVFSVLTSHDAKVQRIAHIQYGQKLATSVLPAFKQSDTVQWCSIQQQQQNCSFAGGEQILCTVSYFCRIFMERNHVFVFVKNGHTESPHGSVKSCVLMFHRVSLLHLFALW